MIFVPSVWVFVSVFITACVLGEETYYDNYKLSKAKRVKNAMLCTRAQSHIDLKELMGLWQVMEVIEHNARYGEHREYLRQSNSRPLIHFSTNGERGIRMIWFEDNGYIQYDFTMTNLNNPGFWMSNFTQSGSMVDDSYEHFSGTAQVMKAVHSHMVLTFCSPRERHFSIVLSRFKYITHSEIVGVHNQLDRGNLPLMKVKRYYDSAASSIHLSAAAATLGALILVARTKIFI